MRAFVIYAFLAGGGRNGGGDGGRQRQATEA